MDLQELRQQINNIDDNLISLFTKRMELAAQIARYKKLNNLPIYVPDREDEILQKVAEKAGTEMADYAKNLYVHLFELSRDYQSKWIEKR